MSTTINKLNKLESINDDMINKNSNKSFEQIQNELKSKYDVIDYPQKKEINWRFASQTKYKFDNLNNNKIIDDGIKNKIIENSNHLSESCCKFIFCNDKLIKFESKGLTDDTNLKITPISELIKNDKENFDDYFSKLWENELSEIEKQNLGSLKYAIYTLANFKDGVIIDIPENVQMEDAIEIYYWNCGENVLSLPVTFIKSGKNTKAKIIEYHLSYEDNIKNSGISCGSSYFFADDSSDVKYIRCQLVSKNMQSLHAGIENIESKANSLSMTLNLGSSLSRSESIYNINGQSCDAQMLSISIADNEQEFDQRTLQVHNQADSKSDLLFKNILFGKGHSIFSGLIKVKKGAHQTDAYQKCNNLLMSDEAEADSMPGLEINADQVKCSHGSTAGQIDTDEIFYLMARGITKNVSQKLIAQGFANEVVEKIKDKKIEELLINFIADKFKNLTV